MAKKNISSVLRSKALKNLETRGLKLVSTPRQLENGTISLAGKSRVGRKKVNLSYKVTANGAVLSNEFVARRVNSYTSGFKAIEELLNRRFGETGSLA